MPSFDYDVIVIGGGAAGFVSSKLANGFGKKTALIEKEKLGGDCTNHGCVPSKALIRASIVAHQTANLSRFGLNTASPVNIDAGGVMAHVRSIVQKVYEGHRPEIFRESGIDVLFGSPRFIDNHSIELNGTIISARNFIIATGSRALIPDIEGLSSVPYLTNETIFDIQELPKSMTILGGGPIGMELASALNRLGIKINVVEMNARILIKEDGELVQILTDRLRGEGLNIMTKTRAVRFFSGADQISVVTEDENHAGSEIISDSLLVAIGRRPNIEGLDLEKAGVAFSSKGIKTDKLLRTSAKNIYACGDVVGPYQFSHMAEYQAALATQNMLLPLRRKLNYVNAAWCTFTDPELAHAGLTEEEARQKFGNGIKVYRHEYANTDRGKTDVAETGMAKFICDSRSRLVGAHILGDRAGDLIHEAQLAKSLNIPFHKIYSVIHIYPTFTDLIKQPSKLCYIDKLQNNIFLKILKIILGKNSR